MSLAESQDRTPYRTVGMLCVLRDGGAPDEAIAKKLHFDSVEKMRDQLKVWKLPDWLVGAESNSGKKRSHEKNTPPRLQRVGPRKDLPPAGNATELFKERLEALLEDAELLKHIDEGLHSRYFARTNVERADVFLPREHYSK